MKFFCCTDPDPDPDPDPRPRPRPQTPIPTPDPDPDPDPHPPEAGVWLRADQIFFDVPLFSSIRRYSVSVSLSRRSLRLERSFV